MTARPTPQESLSLDGLRARLGLAQARQSAEASIYAPGIVSVIDAVMESPGTLWRAMDMLTMAGVVSSFNLDRILTKTIGFDFAELVNRARVGRALDRLAEPGASLDEIAAEYWPPRTRTQMLLEAKANVVVEDNKLSSRENLDAALRRLLGIDLEAATSALRV